jgi:hypothetical protein
MDSETQEWKDAACAMFSDLNKANRAFAKEIGKRLELEAALAALLDRYVGLVNCGDCGFWDPEKEPEVIAARAALTALTPSPPPTQENGQ